MEERHLSYPLRSLKCVYMSCQYILTTVSVPVLHIEKHLGGKKIGYMPYERNVVYRFIDLL